MSNFTAAAKAIQDNPDLHRKITSVTSAEDRASVLREHGVPVPTHAEINDHTSNLEGVTGAGASSTIFGPPGPITAAAAAAGT